MPNLKMRTSVVVLIAVAVLWPTAASAMPLEREHVHEMSSDVVEEFCDDLTVQLDIDIVDNIVMVSHGRDRLAYWSRSSHGTIRITNLANGLTYTYRFAIREKDHEVVDNGDGTLTITVLATGVDQYRGPDGRLVLLNPGQVRFQFLIDHGGTPSDPFDDEFIDDLGVIRPSTGRNDTEGRDFCDDVHLFIG